MSAAAGAASIAAASRIEATVLVRVMTIGRPYACTVPAVKPRARSLLPAHRRDRVGTGVADLLRELGRVLALEHPWAVEPVQLGGHAVAEHLVHGRPIADLHDPAGFAAHGQHV